MRLMMHCLRWKPCVAKMKKVAEATAYGRDTSLSTISHSPFQQAGSAFEHKYDMELYHDGLDQYIGQPKNDGLDQYISTSAWPEEYMASMHCLVNQSSLNMQKSSVRSKHISFMSLPNVIPRVLFWLKWKSNPNTNQRMHQCMQQAQYQEEV